ncbi:nitroreductase family protein [Geobacter argillaceus]|uniref:Nitroreductase n=1 Tax=Geobacter argillaceus TaxID=345631 RepID=A0A562VNS6_9BACT|nr:nitroreductase family protein [Geobacter argillaceus]TWJ19431.1 nitroreductase [Geobacter argillaceus]
MLTTKEAIEERRSIRKFKPEPVPDELLAELLDAARLAPSGCNAQPWRFKIVKDSDTKGKLAQAAFDQPFIAAAPVVLVCCADIRGYVEGMVSCTEDLGKIGAVEDRVVKIILKASDRMSEMPLEQVGPRIALNVAIAVEHIALRALDFGLGSCWIRLFDESAIKGIFGWDDNLHVVALLPLGYPAEAPLPRKRRALEDILL